MNCKQTEFGLEPAQDFIETYPAPLLLQFGANWCEHCQAAQPLIREVLAHYPNVDHIMVEDGKGRLLGRSFQVKLWPSLIFIRQGQEVTRLVRPENIKDIQTAFEKISN